MALISARAPSLTSLLTALTSSCRDVLLDGESHKRSAFRLASLIHSFCSVNLLVGYMPSGLWSELDRYIEVCL